MYIVFKTVSLGFIALALGACSTPVPDTPDDQPWRLVDNFEDANALDDWVIFDAQNDTEPFVPDAQITEIRQEPGTGNAYMIRKPAADGIVGNRKALAWKALPETLAVGNTATFFTRINVEYFPNNHSFGISNQASEAIGTLSYDAFEPMLRVTDKLESNGDRNDGTLMVLSGYKTYAKINNPETANSASPLEPGQWYDLWYIVDNRVKADGGQTYKVYVRGGEFAAQTLVYEGAKFRIGREEPLTHFMSICNTGPARDPYGNGGVLYDDIYMAQGEQLSPPF